MEFISEISLFFLKTLIVMAAIGGVALLILFLSLKNQNKPEIEVTLLHKKLKNYKNIVNFFVLSKKKWSAAQKQEKKDKKAKDKLADEASLEKPRLYVLDFKGDIKAGRVESLREEISAVLLTAQEKDEVLLRLESPGGVVHGYGLAAAQLLRLKSKNIPLTVSVDKVAASGGYMMACTAQKIIASPFGVVGSIGVVAQVPNLNRVLKKYDVDYKEYTAGQYKRTVSFLGEITPQGEAKFLEQLQDTHVLFKNFVHTNRPRMDLEKLATGEHWYGEQALKLGLVDEIMVSDDFILERINSHQIVSLNFEKKSTLTDKLGGVFGKVFASATEKLTEQLPPSSINQSLRHDIEFTDRIR